MAERSAPGTRNRAVLGSSAPLLPLPTTTWICFSVVPGPKSSAMLVNSYCLLPVGVVNPIVLFVLFVPDYLSGLPVGKLARTASAFPL